jgi:NADH-quinone oxidoreductase subunit M
MTDWPLLSVVTFIPLICVLFLLPIKDDTEIGRRNIRQVALLGTTATFVMSLLIWASFDVSDPGFQMVESIDLPARCSPTRWVWTAFRCCSSS